MLKTIAYINSIYLKKNRHSFKCTILHIHKMKIMHRGGYYLLYFTHERIKDQRD